MRKTVAGATVPSLEDLQQLARGINRAWTVERALAVDGVRVNIPGDVKEFGLGAGYPAALCEAEDWLRSQVGARS